MVNPGSKKLTSVLYFLIGVMVIIIINQLSGRLFYRFDLTEEKRYTISDATKNLLSNLEDAVYVDVYLAGDLPGGMKRLQKSIRETLEEFRIYAGNNLQYRFINPSTARGKKARKKFYENLIKKASRPPTFTTTPAASSRRSSFFPEQSSRTTAEKRGSPS